MRTKPLPLLAVAVTAFTTCCDAQPTPSHCRNPEEMLENTRLLDIPQTDYLQGAILEPSELGTSYIYPHPTLDRCHIQLAVYTDQPGAYFSTQGETQEGAEGTEL